MAQFTDNLTLVTKRLDARYDWLPSPQAITAKYHKLPYVSVGDACKPIEANVTGSLALVSMEGTNCSFFTKVKKVHILMSSSVICEVKGDFPLLSKFSHNNFMLIVMPIFRFRLKNQSFE